MTVLHVLLYVIIILMTLLVLAAIFSYEYFDRMRFRLGNCWKETETDMDKWVYMAYSVASLAPDSCEKGAAAASKAYDLTEKADMKAESVKILFSMTEGSRSIETEDERLKNVLAKKLEKERQLTGSCSKLNRIAGKYNNALGSFFPGCFGRLFGFRRFCAVDFKLPPEETTQNAETEQSEE